MLYIDLEVFSEIDLTSSPLDVYANHPSTKIIVACAAYDNGEVLAFADRGDYESIESFMALLGGKGPLNAWNVGYERTVLAGRGFPTPIERWHDTMVNARYVGLPGGLKQCCAVDLLGVPEDLKTKSESALIKKFCMPYSGKTPGTEAEFDAFVEYCRKDVLSTRFIHQKLSKDFPIPERERRVWILDQIINERGLPIDVRTATHAAAETLRLGAENQAKLRALTGLDNPNSVQQLHGWLQEKGYPYDSLGKDFVARALEDERIVGDVREVLEIRLESAKSSVKKFAAIVEGTSPDGRLRNQFRYYGAHTGRWSGRGVQPQNLTRTPHDPAELENLIRRGMVPTIDTLSTCVRPMIYSPLEGPCS
jgi:DNA polymerase